MFVDGRSLSQNAVVGGDICIVGGGAAGITLARDLAGEGRRIVVLESGGLEPEGKTQDLYEGETAGQSFTPLVVDRIRCLGGSTNHWAGYCRPFDQIDFEERLATPGWPFGREELDPFYDRAQSLCQLGPFDYDPQHWTEGAVKPFIFATGSRLTNGVQQLSPPTNFGVVYRADLERASATAVHLHSNAVDIETDPDGGHVTAVQAACLDGLRFTVRAKLYVLAVGGIENPRLLLNCEKTWKRGLGNAHDLVGRYFMDHPFVAEAAQVAFSTNYPELKFYGERTVRGVRIYGHFYASGDTLRKEELPGFAIGMMQGSLPNAELAGASLRDIQGAISSGRIPDHLGYRAGRIWAGVEWHLANWWNRFMPGTPSYYTTSYISGVPPDPDSRVTLIDRRDPLGLRQAKLEWRLPADFASNMRRAHQLLAQDLGIAGLGRVKLKTTTDSEIDVVNAHHHMGTTRMHPDPRQGVVDANCRLHGVANLFVAGSSVFPTYSFDNPTLTLVALALRLSEHLKRELRKV